MYIGKYRSHMDPRGLSSFSQGSHVQAQVTRSQWPYKYMANWLGSSEWPILFGKVYVTFSGIQWPQLESSKGHLEEAGGWNNLTYRGPHVSPFITGAHLVWCDNFTFRRGVFPFFWPLDHHLKYLSEEITRLDSDASCLGVFLLQMWALWTKTNWLVLNTLLVAHLLVIHIVIRKLRSASSGRLLCQQDHFFKDDVVVNWSINWAGGAILFSQNAKPNKNKHWEQCFPWKTNQLRMDTVLE